MQVDWYVLVGSILFVAGGLYDYWRIRTGRKSISLLVWQAETASPTVIVGVLCLGALLAWQVWPIPILAAIVLLITGHLVTSEGAAIAVEKANQKTDAANARADGLFDTMARNSFMAVNPSKRD